jgi:hypothetical protein
MPPKLDKSGPWARLKFVRPEELAMGNGNFIAVADFEGTQPSYPVPFIYLFISFFFFFFFFIDIFLQTWP